MVAVIIILVLVLFLCIYLKNHEKREQTFIKYSKEYPNAKHELLRQYLSEGKHYEDARKLIGNTSEGEMLILEENLIEKKIRCNIEAFPARKSYFEKFIREGIWENIKKNEKYDLDKKVSLMHEFTFNPLKCKRYVLENMQEFDLFIEKKIEEEYRSLEEAYPQALKKYKIEHSNYTKFQIVERRYQIKLLHESMYS